MQAFSRFAGIAAILLALGACATTTNPQDPFEHFNRTMFRFNDVIDKSALKPAAIAYQNVVPSFVQTGIGNFFGNLGDLWNAVNNLLQGKVEAGGSDIMRLGLNTVLGLGGVLDIASETGLPKHNEDFGQTLGRWGVPSGPYVVLPFYGSSTVRDVSALPLDIAADPWTYQRPVVARSIGTLVRVVDQRAMILNASNLIEEAALDPYEFIRDGYLQRRMSRVYDGASAAPHGND